MKGMRFHIVIICFLLMPAVSPAQENYLSKVWVADNGDGTYKNPVLYADYSDPDAIRVGDDFYMTASSFDAVPGLPILHSRDLVNWSLIGHALPFQVPIDHFSLTQHGNGVWAPAIRYHDHIFYIYYPDPDYGIYLTRSAQIGGPWSQPILVAPGKGLIDPCPLWDDDGQVYLVHAFAGSRAGIKSVLMIRKMNATGTAVTDNGVVVYDGHEMDPTVEGPKIYKKDNRYYIFAPAGGVSKGWQLVLRSGNIYGPYERKLVMDQGNTTVNGPHQGAWVSTVSGEDWFLHFQDMGAYGRVVHLQPMHWVDGWPVIGNDPDGNGKGEPVLQFKKPNMGKAYSLNEPADKEGSNLNKPVMQWQYPLQSPVESDEFNGKEPGLQWQWQANPQPGWCASTGTQLRIYAYPLPVTGKNLWDLPNLLLQKFPAPVFTATVKINLQSLKEGERAGLIVMGSDYACITGIRKNAELWLQYSNCLQADKGNTENEVPVEKMTTADIYLRVHISEGGNCVFSYSYDNRIFREWKAPFQAKPGKWIGAKMGLFCSSTGIIPRTGYAEADWFRVTP